jgi:hypothetical protein
MTRLDTLDTAIWYQTGPGAMSDLDIDYERQARVAYLSDRKTHQPGIGSASCYRCVRPASMHVRLRVSSLTPVCAEHADKPVYALDEYGTLTESGPYAGGGS